MTHTNRRPGEPSADDRVRTRIRLRTPVPRSLAPEIERRLFFVSADITAFEVAATDEDVSEVTLYSREPLSVEALTVKVNTMVDTDVRPQWETNSKVIWTSRHERATVPDLYDSLIRGRSLTEAGEGQVAIGEPLLSLFSYFDRTVLRVVAQEFRATEYRYPTLIRTKALETAGYFKAFPQHLMFVTRLHNDIDAYRAVQDQYEGAGIDAAVLHSCENVDYCLPPTMCYHTFHQHSGRTLETERLHVVTSRGKSFRFEAGYATTLERLWDFTIREIVFMGDRQDVLEARELMMSRVFALLEDLGLNGFCEVGNDPFFCGSDTSQQILSQRLLELKYELRLPVSPEHSIAVGSFNFHGDLFGRRFGILRGSGEPTNSGCIGFGLERLVYAFLCQYGLDTAGWPPVVRDGVTAVSGG
ncbi:hypothetical protein ACWIG5_29340 [Streptomyces lydicus]